MLLKFTRNSKRFQRPFYYLRQIRLVRRSLTMDAAHALVRAMTHSRLDYCNILLAGLPTGQMSRLQSVLRGAARLVLGLPGRAPVSAVEHSDSRFESIHRFILSESIRIDSFCKKNRPFDSIVVLQFFLLIYCSLH